jgi:hypothetical protein
MTSELTGVEGVQLGILLYHFFHSHLGKTKYIGNSVSDYSCKLRIWYGTQEAGLESLGRPRNIHSPQRFMHKRLVFLVYTTRDYVTQVFNIHIESERTAVSGKFVNNSDFIGR